MRPRPLMNRRVLTVSSLLAVIVSTAALAGCGGGAAAPKLAVNDVAVVGSQHITLADFNGALSEEKSSLKASGTAVPKVGTSQYESLETTIIDALVQQAEFEIEAAKLGVTVTPAEVQAQLSSLEKQYFKGSAASYQAAVKKQGFTDAEVVDNLRERLLENKLFARVTATTTVSEAQIQTYYLENLSTYQKPPERKVLEILVGKKKQALAEQIYNELKVGANFAALAKKYSQDPGTKDSGGNFTAEKGQDVPGFDAAVFASSAKIGELLAPVNTSQYGWFVIKILGGIVPSKVTPESAAAPAIRKQLLTTQRQQALGTWAQNLAKSYCSGQISYQVGYSPSPDPCAALSTANQTTT